MHRCFSIKSIGRDWWRTYHVVSSRPLSVSPHLAHLAQPLTHLAQPLSRPCLPFGEPPLPPLYSQAIPQEISLLNQAVVRIVCVCLPASGRSWVPAAGAARSRWMILILILIFIFSVIVAVFETVVLPVRPNLRRHGRGRGRCCCHTRRPPPHRNGGGVRSRPLYARAIS